MSPISIAAITLDLQNQPGWEGIRDWGLIIQAWKVAVSPAIATRSRPKSLSKEVLTIATNSASLAHQLTFGRKALCQQLNSHLITPVIDLRFAPIGYREEVIAPEGEDLAIPIDSGEIVDCPQCSCPARTGELFRWGVCQFCAIDSGILGGRPKKSLSNLLIE